MPTHSVPVPEWQLYADQMSVLGLGIGLWHPSPTRDYSRISIGSVGYVEEGRFHLLFDAGKELADGTPSEDVPNGFKPLKIGSVLTDRIRRPGMVKSNYIEAVGLASSPHVDLPMSIVNGGGLIKFDTRSSKGAVVVTRHKTYCSDADLKSGHRQELNQFESYMRGSYKSWLTFARQNGHKIDVEDILLVTGTDMSKEFSILAFSKNKRHKSFELEVDAIPSNRFIEHSPSDWSSWSCQFPTFEHSVPLVNEEDAADRSTEETRRLHLTALHPDSQTTPHPESNQCLFLRGIRLYRRGKVLLEASGEGDRLTVDRKGKQRATESSSSRMWGGDEDEIGSASHASQKFVDRIALAIARYIFKTTDSQIALVRHSDWTMIMNYFANESGLPLSIIRGLNVDWVINEVKPTSIVDTELFGYLGDKYSLRHFRCSAEKIATYQYEHNAQDTIATSPDSPDVRLATESTRHQRSSSSSQPGPSTSTDTHVPIRPLRPSRPSIAIPDAVIPSPPPTQHSQVRGMVASGSRSSRHPSSNAGRVYLDPVIPGTPTHAPTENEEDTARTRTSTVLRENQTRRFRFHQ